MKFHVKKLKKISVKDPVLIEGLPGIGNVGKIAVDILIEELKAEKIMEFFSYSLPNSVFVNEDNLVELPKVELYYKHFEGKNFLLLGGDAQPVTEEASYEFSDTILNIVTDLQCDKIITLGGIGLADIPHKPKVYCTGNNKQFIREFKLVGAHTNIYGIVGPIIGVSGLLLGLGQKRKIKGAALLSETFGHPMYIGLPGAKQILSVLVKKYGFKLDLTELDKEIAEMEKEMTIKPTQSLAKKYLKYKDTNYIG